MKYYPQVLVAIYIVFLILLAIHTSGYKILTVEIIPIIISFLLLVFTYNSYKVPNTSYTFVIILKILHTMNNIFILTIFQLQSRGKNYAKQY